MKTNEITRKIISAAIEVHNTLGPGLLENVYQQCMIVELNQRGLRTQTQLSLPVLYKKQQIDLAYRLDILVEDSIILELKSCQKTSPLHKAQLFSYLKLSNKKFGLLINFNTKLLKDGITRIVNPHLSA